MSMSNMNQLDVKQYQWPHEITENIRRSANYKPNIWKHNFLQSLASKYDKEEFRMQLKKRIIKVKGLLAQEKGSVLQKLELVDWIQKLGLANYFQKEINDALETVFVSLKNSNNFITQDNLHGSSLCFRLLRQHGYKVLPDILGDFLDEKGIVMKSKSSSDDGKDLMELLEASHLCLEGENILDGAKHFAKKFLKDTSSQIVERVVHALELPSHRRVPWFDVKWHVSQYQIEKHMDPILLELSKLNFNIIQAKLQKEVKELSRWWENLDLKKDLSFARNRLVESFMCAAGVAFEPKNKSIRKWLTKVIMFIVILDDIYDIHALFEELEPFTVAFDRWDSKELEDLPDYMRICFNTLKDITNEIAYEIAGEKHFDMVLAYLKKAWRDFCNALYKEAKWYKTGYIPSFQEYLSNAWITSSGPVILLHSYFATMHEEVTDEIGNFLHTYEDLIFNVSLVIRLCNDLATSVIERERGDAASSILCYMNQMDASEEEARKHIQNTIDTAWKKINGHCFTGNALVEPFLTQAQNAARVAHTLYLNGDGFGVQDRDIKKHIVSLLVEPL